MDLPHPVTKGADGAQASRNFVQGDVGPRRDRRACGGCNDLSFADDEGMIVNARVLAAGAAVLVLLAGALTWARVHSDSSDAIDGGAGTTTTAPGTTIPTTTTTALAGARHNIVVVMVDDATYEEIRVMKNVKAMLAAEGTSFSNFYTTTPNCCPSRGGFYLGQYPHNSGVKDNIPPLGGANAFVPHENESLGVWMQRAGYYTAQIGKYLNGYGNPEKPDDWKGGIKPQPGWDHWFVDIDPTTYEYYDYKISDDGIERAWGHQPQDYQTDVTGAEAVKTIKTAAATKKPWFIAWTPMSPHVATREGKETNSAATLPGSPTTSAPGPDEKPLVAVAADKYKGMFASEPLPKSPSMVFGPGAVNTPDLQGKPTYVKTRVTEFPAPEALMREAYQIELEALQSIDEWVGNIYRTLQELGQLDNTEIIFWSDNGLFHGEHNLVQKGLLYEEAAHIPLIIRGPGFPAGKTADQLTLNIDLTPTILSIAGATAGTPLDGRNLAPVANDPTAARDRAILLEYWYSYTRITTNAVRFGPWSYIEWSTGELELYDLKTDPYQMTNLSTDPSKAKVMAELRARLAALATCKGATCEDSDLSRHPS
jgi:arylsulfatase A-like enzyme